MPYYRKPSSVVLTHVRDDCEVFLFGAVTRHQDPNDKFVITGKAHKPLVCHNYYHRHISNVSR